MRFLIICEVFGRQPYETTNFVVADSWEDLFREYFEMDQAREELIEGGDLDKEAPFGLKEWLRDWAETKSARVDEEEMGTVAEPTELLVYNDDEQSVFFVRLGDKDPGEGVVDAGSDKRKDTD